MNFIRLLDKKENNLDQLFTKSYENLIKEDAVSAFDTIENIDDYDEKLLMYIAIYGKMLIDSMISFEDVEDLSAVLNKIDAGIIMTDKSGRILMCNRYANDMFEIDKRGYVDKPIPKSDKDLNWIVDFKNNSQESFVEKNIGGETKYVKVDILKFGKDTFGILGVVLDMSKFQKLDKKTGISTNKNGLKSKYTFQDFKYKDLVSKEFIDEAKLVGKTDYTLLLYGESGCGKEIIAHSIHNISKRSLNNFVPINCSAISESLLESELFGYEEGAFTGAKKGGKLGIFELANYGTLFLDEINALPLNIQTKLLRVIEEKQIMRIGSDKIIPLNIRIIAATNEPLLKKIEEGTFRADLYYRLSSLELTIPPLRERKEDILLLFKNFAYETRLENGWDMSTEKLLDINLSEKDKEVLRSHNWYGNVRELKNVARKFVITGKIDLRKRYIQKQSSQIDIDNSIKIRSEKNTVYNKTDLNDINIDMKEIQKHVEIMIIDMMIEQGLSKNEIAKILGISRTSLWKKYSQIT